MLRFRKEAINDVSSELGMSESQVEKLAEKLATNDKFVEAFLRKVDYKVARRVLTAMIGGGLITATALPAAARMVVSDKFIELDGQKFYPAAKGAYSAIVYKEGDLVIAEDPNGRIIDQGTAGVDDARVIQSAILQIGEGVVRLGKGNFKISAPITLESNITLKGEGIDATILTYTGTSNCIEVKGTASVGKLYWGIEDLTIIGSSSAVYGVNLEYASFGKLNNLKITGFGDSGLRLYNSVGNTLVNVQSNLNTNYGFAITWNSNATTLVNCKGSKNGLFGFWVWNSATVTFIGGVFEDNDNAGGKISCSAGVTRGIVLEGVHFETNNATAGTETLDISSGTTDPDNFVRSVVLKGCIFIGRGTGYNGIQLRRNVYGVKIEACEFQNFDVGVHTTVGTPDTVILEGNTFWTDVTTPFSFPSTNNVKVGKNYGALGVNSDTATISADGAATQFTIPHGLVSTPKYVSVEPKAGAPKPDNVDADATNIILTFNTAPAAGTYYYWWKAEV